MGFAVVLPSLLLLIPSLWLLHCILAYARKTPTVRLPPGPLPVPLFGHWLQVGNQITARKLAALAHKYGDIFLLKMGRRNLVAIHSPELAKEMLQTRGVQFGSRARNVVTDIFSGSGQDLAFSDYGEHWRKARRIVTVPFFTSHAIQRWRTSREAEIDGMLDRLSNKREAFEEGVMIRDSLHLMIYNNLYMAAFGRKFDSEYDPLYLELKRLNDQRSRLVQSFDYNYGDFHPIFQFLVRGYLTTCREVKEGRERLFKHFISERMKLFTTPGSCSQDTKIYGINYLLAAAKDGEIKEENVLYLLENLNAAGIDTILISLEWLIAELVNNPDVQNKLYREVRSVAGPGGALTEPAFSKLQYLQAVLKETMRMHPTAPLIVPHTNPKPEKLGGYYVPARSRVIVNAWWLANNPEWWTNPEEFNPERFMGGEEEEWVEMNGSSCKFLPFGLGRRQCPGMGMALSTLRLAIAKLVLRFELLAPPVYSHPHSGNHKKQKKVQVDLRERGGQFLLPMAVSPHVLLKHRNPSLHAEHLSPAPSDETDVWSLSHQS